MSKASTILVLGLLEACIPFLGLPSTLKTTFAVTIALIIAVVAFFVREERLWLLKELGETKILDHVDEQTGGERRNT